MRQLIPHFILTCYHSGQFFGSLKAAGLFLDLSGFSKMADILSGYDQPGAEALAEVMRKVFDPLVRAVYAQGGFVVGFSGDAFTAIFPEQEDLEPAMLRCLESAIWMQAYVRGHPQAETPFGQYPISVKVGISYGQADWNILESSNSKRATYHVHGSSVDGAVAAEKLARPGEILVDALAYDRLRKVVECEPVEDCFRLTHIRATLPAPNPILDPLPTPEGLQVFLPEKIITLPAVGEFRQIVNLFIDIPIDPTDDSVVKPFIDFVFNLQAQYGGYFLRPEISDKGFNLLMFWGAPVAHETDIERALNFVLALTSQTGLSIKAGITYLTAYAGFIGAMLREDYTAYGWGVNLAARFMNMAAPGEVWIDAEVARRAERHFNVKYRDIVSVKGFKRKQKVYILHGRKELTERVYYGKLIGRNRELERLSNFVHPIFEGEFAGVLVIQGEAGIGKSHLVHTYQHTESFIDNPVQWIVCQTDEILRQSLNPFDDWLLKRFSVSESNSDKVNFEHFSTRLQKIIDSIAGSGLVSELGRTSSVLAAMLGLFQPGSLYEQLDAKERYENTFIALSTLLRAESLQRPLVLFIEDVQWLDDDSRAFLPYLIRTVLAEPDNQYPIAILATRRPEGDSLQFGEALEPQLLDLDRLPPGDLSHLAEDILGGRVSPALLELLERRTDGNPFFAEQILRYLADKNLLTENKEGLFDTDLRAERSLPLDVGAILIARLDSLAQDVRELVQTASILGREFEVQLLSGMLRGDAGLPQKITRAEHADIWYPLDQIRYIFRHALLRDAAYSMQLLTRQRELHALAVSAIELLYENELGPHYGELAYHAERANLVEKALLYLPQAGKLAASVYQNRQAVDYFSQAIGFTPPEDLRAKFGLLLERANLYGLMGERGSQLKDLEMLERLSRQLDDDALLAQVWMLRADYAYAISDYQYALERSREALVLAQSARIEDVALDAYRVSPLALLRQGKLSEAMQQAVEGLQLVRQMGRRIEEGNILNSMGLIALEQKETKVAKECLVEAVNIAQELGNLVLQGKALNNLAHLAGTIQGDFCQARKYLELAYEIFHERGDRYGQGILVANLGWCAGMQGDFRAARKYLERSLTIAREVGNAYQEAYTLINLSSVTGIQGEAWAAIKYANQAYDMSLKISDRSGEAWSYLNLGHAFLLNGEFKKAQSAYENSIAIRDELEQLALAMEPTAGLIQVALNTNDLITAVQHTEVVLEYLANDGTFEGSEEPLRIYLACFNTLDKINDPRSHDVLQRAIHLLDAQVSMFSDEESRQMYVQNVPWRQAIQDAWETSQLNDHPNPIAGSPGDV